ncbi:MAG: ABC transporter permease [Alphaproteobacteria bacterium]
MKFPRMLAHSPTANLLWELVFSQVKLRYKRSALGLGWSLLHPLLMMAVFTIVLGRFPRLADLPVPYHIFFLSGYLPWTFFAIALSNGQSSLIANASLVKQVAFRKWLLPLASVGANLVHAVLALALFVVYLIIYPAINTSAQLLWLIPLLLLQTAGLIGLALALSAWVVSFRDLGPILEVLLAFLFYLTPVFYDFSIFSAKDAFLVSVLGLNPFAALLACYRAAFFSAPMPLGQLAYVVVWVAALLWLGGAVFARRSGALAKEL